ncbi:hypothetical protein ACNQ1M_00595 [Mycoplasma sp. VS424B]|uniref:hypothetical protein n=1 Tax=Mycoplasma sp. VS424B TaxID=3401660 RepID=UPI003AAAC8FA
MKKISKYVALMPLAAAPIIAVATSENNEEVNSENDQAGIDLRAIDVQRIMEWIKSNDDAFIRKFPIMQNNQTIDDFLNKWDIFSDIKSHNDIKQKVEKELNDPDKYYDIMKKINDHFGSGLETKAIATIDNVTKLFKKFKEVLDKDKIRDYYAIYTFLEWAKSLSVDKEIPKINSSDNTDNKYWNFYNDDKFYDIRVKTSILGNFNIVFGEGDINTLFKNNFSSFSYDNVNDISSFVKDINNIYYPNLIHKSGFKLFKTIMNDAYENRGNLDVEKYLRIFDELGRSEISTKIFWLYMYSIYKNDFWFYSNQLFGDINQYDGYKWSKELLDCYINNQCPPVQDNYYRGHVDQIINWVYKTAIVSAEFKKLNAKYSPVFEANKKEENYKYSNPTIKSQFNAQINALPYLSELKTLVAYDKSISDVVAGIKAINNKYFPIEPKFDISHLNGNSNLAKIQSYKNISKTSADAFKNMISNATTDNDVTEIFKTIKNLDDVLKNTPDLNKKFGEIKNTTKYKFSDSQPQSNYDTRYNDFENKLNSISEINKSSTYQNVNDLISQFNTSIQETKNAAEQLNGEVKYNKLISERINEISKLDNLSASQKENITKLIKTQTDKHSIEDIVYSAVSLNDIIGKLKTQKLEDEAVTKTISFTESDNKLKEDFNNKANAIVTKITELGNFVFDNSLAQKVPVIDDDARELILNAKSAARKLNGDDKMAKAKSSAIATIGTLDKLNSAVIDEFKKEVINAKDITSVEAIKSKATSQNHTISEILDSLQRAEALKNNAPVYNNATAEQKQALESAINYVKNNILDESGKKMKPNNLVNEIASKKEVIDNTIATINQLSSQIATEQQNAKENIQKLQNLTQEQKETLKNDIDSATSIESVNQKVSNASKIDQATKQFKTAIESAKTIDKQSRKYANSTEEAKNYFDTALKEAEIIYRKELKGKTAEQIKILADKLSQAVKNIDGDIRWNKYLNEQKADIDVLDNLSIEQRNKIKARIDAAPDTNSIKPIKEAAGSLNRFIKDVKEAQDDVATIKQGNNYQQAEQSLKTSFDDKVDNLDKVLANAKVIDSFDNLETINKLANNLKAGVEDYNKAKTALNGDLLISNAKDKVQTALSNSTHLSNEYKEGVKQSLDSNNSVTDLNNLATAVTDLNAAANNLIIAANKLETALQEPQYANASEKTKAKVANAQKKNSELLANNLLINGQKQPAVTSAIEVNNLALEAIQADKEALQNAKAQAIEALKQLANLSQSQINTITQIITDANTTAIVTETLNNARSLNTSMGELIAAYNKFDNAKSETKYTQASETSKNQFDKEYSNKQTYSKDVQTSIKPEEISKITEIIKQIYNSLDGGIELDKAKQVAKDKIEKLSNLDLSAKQAAYEAIDKAVTKEQAETIVDNETTLDQKILTANNILKDCTTIKGTLQYKEATDSKQTALDKAFEALKKAINDAKAQSDLDKVTSTIEDLNGKASDLTSAKNELDGNANLASAKKVAKAVIEALTNIDTPVKNHFESQMDAKSSIKEIEAIAIQATATDTAAKELINTVDEAIKFKDKPDYNFARRDQKENLTEALETAKSFLKTDNNKLYINTTPDVINGARETLSRAIIEASSQADKILKAQKAAIDKISKLTDLTDQQKADLTHEVFATTTDEKIQTIVTKASELDQITKEFKNTVKVAEKLNKADEKYKYADENKQSEFDSELQDAQLELAKGLAGKNKEQIKILNDSLSAAQKALNGDSKVTNTKQEAKEQIKNLDNLNKNQADIINGAIDNSTSPEEANKLASKAQDLNDAITKAKQTQKEAQEVKGTSKYTEPSDPTKNSFNEATSKLDSDITNAISATDLSTAEKLDNLIKTLKEDTTKVNDANKGLDGDTLLERAKAEANGAISSASHLSPQVAETFKQQVKEATTIAAVNKIKANVKDTQAAAEKLINNLDKVNTALQTSSGSADPATLQEALDVSQEANKLLENHKLKQGVDITKINQISDKLSAVINKFKTNADALKQAQNNATDKIDALPNLSSSQKEALINEVKGKNSPSDIDGSIAKAKELDKACEELKNNLNSLNGTQAQDNYKLADKDKQKELNNIIDDVQNIRDQVTKAVDKAAIEAINDKINTAKNALNGNDNKQKANAAIDSLNNLNSNQKSAAKETLNQAENKAQLDAKVKSAQDLDTAKANLAKEKVSLDALINQFTKPNNSSQAILSGFESQVNTINTNKQALEDAKTKANDALNATTLNADQVAQALTTIARAKKQAANAIDTIVTNNNSIISAANIANFINNTDKQNANEFATKALDKKANLYEGIANARQVQHLAALDQLAKFKDNLAQDLKTSNTFALTLNGAQEELQASNTKASDDETLAKVNHQLLKDKLALAYDAISKANINDSLPENLKQEIEAQKAKALELLKYANTVVTTPRATYDAQADKLNLLLAKNDLASVIVNAQAAEKSSQLEAGIKQAQDALNNPAFDQDAIKAASDKLANEIDKAKLYVSINQANDFVEELQEGNKQHHSALRDRIVNTLSNDDIPKATAAANKQDTKAGYNTAAAALDNAVASAKKTIGDVYKALEELRNKIATMPEDAKSDELKAVLNQTKDINKDSSVVAIENALETLQHKYATNELDKAIAAAPTINDKYASLVPNIVEQSQAVSNNPQASTQEIASQLAKQLLNNAKGNALNSLVNLTNLNNAQASALANAIAQAKDNEQLINITTQASQLNKAMSELKDTYTKVDQAYKNETNLPYEFFFAPANKQQFIKNIIAIVGKITPETGQVYIDNLPAQINQLNSDLNTVLDLLGQGKNQAKVMEEEFTKLHSQADSLQSDLNANANKLFNSPKAIQESVNTLQNQIKDLSNKYFDNHADYMQEGNAKLKELINQLNKLNEQVKQFSPQVFMQGNTRITQIQNAINNNSEFVKDQISQENLSKFNQALTYKEAKDILDSQIFTNHDLKSKIDQVVRNLQDILENKNDNSKQNATLIDAIKPKAKENLVNEIDLMRQQTKLLQDNKKLFEIQLQNPYINDKVYDAVVKKINNTNEQNFESYTEFSDLLNSQSKNLKARAAGIKEILDAIKTQDDAKLTKGINLLNPIDKNNANLAKVMKDNDFISILAKAKDKSLTKEDLNKIAQMKESCEYQKASPLIQSLLDQKLQMSRTWAWWSILVAIASVGWIAGIIALCYKRK